MLKEKLDKVKGFETVWGKVITEKEAYKLCLRQEAAFSANLFQVMRIVEPSWEKRTAAIAEMANMMNMSVSGSEEQLKTYMNEELYEMFNIPEFVERSAWLGAFFGDSGDERENMAGRVIQFTRNRVEKELDTCPWDIVGSELCNMTTAMFTCNFDLAAKNAPVNEVCLNMCEARGFGHRHCRVVAERRDVYGLEQQGWLDHTEQPVDPVHDTPKERMVTECQQLRNGQYTNTFGEEQNLEWSYAWCASYGWAWSVIFPLLAIRDLADERDIDEDELLRIFRIVFSTAGKNAFIDPFAVEGMRQWLGVPHEIGWNDPRLIGGYVKAMLDCQLVPNEMVAFTDEEVAFEVNTEDFIGRFPMSPLDELIIGYEALWTNMAKTMVSTEWSCWFENIDEEILTIKIGRKVDKRVI